MLTVGCGVNVDEGVRYPGPEAMYEYDLFAVINHEGQIDNGHYTNYARFQDEVSP
jgi:ubiquitin carboxyl-terminal hydrolase 22/27/51